MLRLTLTLSSAHVRGLGVRVEKGQNSLVDVHLPPHSIHIMPMRELVV